MKTLHISLSSGTSFTEEEVPGFGTKISSEYGHISVITGAKFAPAKHSVTDFVVREEHRGTGHGHALIKEVIRRYKTDIGAQCSSDSSVALFYKYGFRMPDDPHHSLKDAFDVKREYSSVYLKLV
jgi:GNAT superfamily N-acetyltransferase